MKATPKKTARFTQVVRECGRPAAYTLWVKPKADKVLTKAIEQERVMTLFQPNVGTAKDYGLIGFGKHPHASLLIFPKRLTKFAGKRIVGINYDLIQNPEPRELAELAKTPAKKKHVAALSTLSFDNLHTYRVTVECVATRRITRDVEAETEASAQRKALDAVAKLNVDFGSAPRKDDVLEVSEV
jgi:hypothetical protein